MLLLKKAKPKKNNKSKSKKQRTFTSSEYSLPEDRNQSLSQLFRNDLLKRKTQTKNNKSQKQLITTKKRTKSKSKLKLDKCQTYQIIPYKNSLNSQIIFSNEETKREGSVDDSVSEQLAIRVNQQYLVDSNRQLRISIKKEYQKKVEAAIKIQKVFRGYLTRKILQKYVQQEQKILSQRLASHQSQSISEHSSYFADKEVKEVKKRVRSQNQELFQYSNQQENDQEQSEEELDRAIYRHHQPIYSHQELSGYLSSSEEQDFDQDAFNNHIIFETNQEYIDSRKSSGQQQQPRNKLSHPRPPPAIIEEAPNTPNNPPALQEQDLSKTQKKADRERLKSKIQDGEIKQDTLKLNQQGQKIKAPIPAFLQKIEYGATMKEKESLMKKKSEKYIEQEAVHVSRLKQVEMMRWEEIIGLVQSQLSKSQLDNLQVNSFMQKIMDMSIKNKKLLELEPAIEPNDHQMILESSLTKINSKNKLKSIRANRQYLNHNDIFEEDGNLQLTQKINSFEEIQERQSVQLGNYRLDKKKDNFLLPESCFFDSQKKDKNEKVEQKKSDVAASFHSPISSFQNTGQMKRFLSANIQDEHIDQMLKLRQELLKKRQEQQVQKLNVDIDRNLINQEEFSSKLEMISIKYGAEKACIQKAKQDISKGFQAAMKLTKQAFNDAKKLGFHLPVSRSLEGLKFKTPLIYNDIIIDQMVRVKKEDRIRKVSQTKKQEKPMLNSESDHESSDLEFTQQELKRFRRAQPYDIQLAEEIADMGRNVMISQELFRQQQLDQEQNILMKTQHVYKEIYQIEEASPQPMHDPKIQLLTEKILEWTIFEGAGDLFVKPLFSQRLIKKGNFSKPNAVSDKEKLKFIEYLQKHFPTIEQLNAKLNQKICPLPSQLLRCMRIDFSQEEEDDQNSYQQIGKYEFIIGQDICNLAISTFKKEFQEQTPSIQPSLMEIQHFSKEFVMNQKVLKYLQQRQKYISNRKNHTKELRWQVLNIELHCIFDAWNQQLIFLRSQKAGYSGIGLNELTLSVKDHNCLVPLDQTLSLVRQGKKRLINNLSISSPSLIFPLIIDEDQQQQLQADSRWIFYADEALSYGLELVYLIQDQLFGEMAKWIGKWVLKTSQT